MTGFGFGFSPSVRNGALLNLSGSAILNLSGAIIEKADGYYFTNDNGDDAKICKSLCAHFTSGQDHWVGSVDATESAMAPTDGVFNEYEYLIKFDSLVNAPANSNERNILRIHSIGLKVQLVNDKIQVITQSAIATRTVISTIAIPDTTNWHVVKIGFDLRNMSAVKVIITIDGVSEEFAITATGSTYQGATSTQLDSLNTAGYSLIYFKVKKDGILTYQLDFSQKYSSNIFESVSGTLNTYMRNAKFETQDVYPTHILEGFTLYSNGSAYIYVPKKADGTFLNPTISGYTKVADYAPGNGHNYTESEIFDGTNYITVAQLTSFPITKYASRTTGLLVTNMLVFSDNLTATQINRVLSELGYDLADVALFLGDSIIFGWLADKTELTGDITDPQTLVKIYDTVDQALETLTIDNATMPYAGSRPNAFSPALNFAFLKASELYLICYAVGGAELATHWLNTQTYNTALKLAITKAAHLIYKAGKYPNVIGIYASLGQNDSSTPAKRDAVGTNLIALQADLRAYIGQNPKWHHQLLHVAGVSDRETVNNIILALDQTAQKMLCYSAEDLTYTEADTVHPDTAGTLLMGEKFYNEDSV